METSNIFQSLGFYFPFILMFLVMYFLLIRPQNKKQRKHDSMLESLKKGDKIITRGGLMGKILETQGKESEILILDTETGSNLRLMRSYVSGKIK